MIVLSTVTLLNDTSLCCEFLAVAVEQLRWLNHSSSLWKGSNKEREVVIGSQSSLQSFTAMSHLSSGKVNLAQVRETGRRDLLNCIDRCPGSKAVVWDEKLTGPVGLVAEYSLLKEHEVGKMFPLSRGKLPHCEEQNIIFLVRPKIELMEIIAGNIKLEESKGSSKEYHIFFVPRKSLLCEQKLQVWMLIKITVYVASLKKLARNFWFSWFQISQFGPDCKSLVCTGGELKVKVKLRFSATSAGIAEIEET